jgi:hypothetical protein
MKTRKQKPVTQKPVSFRSSQAKSDLGLESGHNWRDFASSEAASYESFECGG